MDLLFQGRDWLSKGWTPEYLIKAHCFFERAMALDPENIEAMVGLTLLDVTVGAAQERRLVRAVFRGRDNGK